MKHNSISENFKKTSKIKNQNLLSSFFFKNFQIIFDFLLNNYFQKKNRKIIGITDRIYKYKNPVRWLRRRSSLCKRYETNPHNCLRTEPKSLRRPQAANNFHQRNARVRLFFRLKIFCNEKNFLIFLKNLKDFSLSFPQISIVDLIFVFASLLLLPSEQPESAPAHAIGSYWAVGSNATTRSVVAVPASSFPTLILQQGIVRATTEDLPAADAIVRRAQFVFVAIY